MAIWWLSLKRGDRRGMVAGLTAADGDVLSSREEAGVRVVIAFYYFPLMRNHKCTSVSRAPSKPLRP